MIAFCMVVRNDTDILRNNLIYQYNIGFRDFYILQHKATEEQKEILHNIEAELIEKGCKFFITRHDKDVHYHDKDMRILTDQSRKDGFKWIMGCDADEMIRLKKHSTIQELIAEYDYLESVELRFTWYEHRPLCDVYQPENAFKTFCRREVEPRIQEKAIGAFDKDMFYCPGVHLIHNAKVTIVIAPDVAYYSHFPDRNILQYEEKYNIQYVNWLERYKEFSLAKQMDDDPLFLQKNWKESVLKQVYERNTVYDRIEDKYFEI